MLKNWPEMAEKLNPLVASLRKAQPDVMKAFGQMAQAATRSEALDTKTKELIALGISVAIRCDPCITYHAKAAVKSGATDAELAEAMGLAVYMGAGPSAMYAAQALEAAGQWRQELEGPEAG
ncbi:carboxymuconolactone decarboxylase family protein [Sandaracinobacteroides sp. A072]|uniref:carboxymuconolactone decarboxylase family protein n=1 Tax=Sandaracinobacteroides sp. A072 TaxID=3461146 RepID=UPI004042BF76